MKNQKIIRSNLKYIILLVWVFLCLSITLHANAKIVLYSFEEIVDEADIILIGEVKKVNKNLFCRDKAKVQPIKILKGNLTAEHFIIKFGNIVLMPKEDDTQFMIGSKYVLFLSKEKKNFVLKGFWQGCYYIEQGEYICFKQKKIKLKEFIEKIEAILNK